MVISCLPGSRFTEPILTKGLVGNCLSSAVTVLSSNLPQVARDVITTSVWYLR